MAYNYSFYPHNNTSYSYRYNYQNVYPPYFYQNSYRIRKNNTYTNIDNNSSEVHTLENSGDRDEDVEFLDIFGIKLYYDDILLICLLFFLYNEGVKDQYLFISLILLLLS